MNAKRRRAPRSGLHGDVRKAVSLHRAGDLTGAQRLYETILEADPDAVEALHFLGVLHHQRGESGRAIELIERAIALSPDYADAYNNLGNVLKETEQLEPAFRAYRRVVELQPDHADAWNNLGVVLRGRGRYEEAEAAYACAIAANPVHVAAWQNRGNVLARLKRYDEAVSAFLRVLDLRPRDAAAYDALTRTLYRAGRTEQAMAVYQKWLRVDPGNNVVQHMLAACGGGAAPARASDAYVRDTFDLFAESFDEVLDRLGYRAPTLIAHALDQLLPAHDGSLAVVDAGCGTGLCAGFLRPRANRLVGVDLSPGMLARARRRKQYDDLVEAELCAWLAGQCDAFDLIVSADTLCYFGALEGVAAAARCSLRPQGLLVFTVERAEGDVAAYHLNPSGRYSHAERYVADTLGAARLTPIGIDRVVLRRENGQDVHGMLVSAQRPA